MDRILKGVMRYRGTTREQMVKEFKHVKDNPHVSSFFKPYLIAIIGSDIEPGNFETT